MADIVFTTHARATLNERRILEDWVWLTIQSPDRQERGQDDNAHYLKAIAEFDGRILRVVVNDRVDPNRIVTVFFDRRLRRRA